MIRNPFRPGLALALLSAFVMLGVAPSAHSQIATNRCMAATAHAPSGNCPASGSCTVSVSVFKIVRKKNCGGCCVFGEASVSCDSASISSSFGLCAECGGSDFIEILCPETPPAPLSFVSLACSQCP